MTIKITYIVVDKVIYERKNKFNKITKKNRYLNLTFKLDLRLLEKKIKIQFFLDIAK